MDSTAPSTTTPSTEPAGSPPTPTKRGRKAQKATPGTSEAPTERKPKRGSGPLKTNAYGISPRSPFAFCAETVVKNLCLPRIKEIISTRFDNASPSMEALVKAFKEETGSCVSIDTMRKWLATGGVRMERRTIFVQVPPPVSEPIPAAPLPDASSEGDPVLVRGAAAFDLPGRSAPSLSDDE